MCAPSPSKASSNAKVSPSLRPSLRSQSIERCSGLPRPTSSCNTKRSRTGCSGRKRSWSEAPLVYSPVPLTENTHKYLLYCHVSVYASTSQTPTSSFTTCVEYENALRRSFQGYADSVKKHSSEGNRVSTGGTCVCGFLGGIGPHCVNTQCVDTMV